MEVQERLGGLPHRGHLYETQVKAIKKMTARQKVMRLGTVPSRTDCRGTIAAQNLIAVARQVDCDNYYLCYNHIWFVPYLLFILFVNLFHFYEYAMCTKHANIVMYIPL